MWLIYRKSDGKIVGASAESEIDLDKESALAEVVRGQKESKELKDYDAVEVKDRNRLATLSDSIARGRATVAEKTSGSLEVAEAASEAGNVAVTTNATQFHPVDNVPLIPGDGQSFLVVTLQKSDDSGKPLIRKTKDNDVIWLRIDQGRLLEDKDQNPQEIRSVTLVAGTAKFRIQSAAAKRLATVQMLTANPELRVGGLRVEFT